MAARDGPLARVRVRAEVSAAVAGVAAMGWIGQRGFGAANPVAPWVETAASHGALVIGILAMVALAVSIREQSGVIQRVRS